MSDDFEDITPIGDSIETIVNTKLLDLKTNAPAKIVKYDKDRQMADVQPLWVRVTIDEESGEEIKETLSIIQDVPIQFPRYGNYVILFPLKKDDPIWLQFAERSIETYLESDGKTILDPEDNRKHNINDAFGVPCFSTNKTSIINVDPDNFVIRDLSGDTELHITPSKEVQIKAAAVRLGSLNANKPIGLADPIEERLNALEIQITLPHGSPAGATVPPPFLGLKPNIKSNIAFVKS